MPTASRVAAHNIDLILALLGLPVFAAAGWPLEGWFWAVALWAANRFLAARIERRAKDMPALRAVGVMGASMMLRPWIGMLVLFLITRHDDALLLSSVLFFLVLLSIDILTRVILHKNIRRQIGGAV
jgi:biotin transporter BioY